MCLTVCEVLLANLFMGSLSKDGLSQEGFSSSYCNKALMSLFRKSIVEGGNFGKVLLY